MEGQNKVLPGRSMVPKLLVSGTLTVGLYGAFFSYIDPLFVLFSSQTVIGAVAVIVTATIFSFIHGAFARYLLEALGI